MTPTSTWVDSKCVQSQQAHTPGHCIVRMHIAKGWGFIVAFVVGMLCVPVYLPEEGNVSLYLFLRVNVELCRTSDCINWVKRQLVTFLHEGIFRVTHLLINRFIAEFGKSVRRLCNQLLLPEVEKFMSHGRHPCSACMIYVDVGVFTSSNDGLPVAVCRDEVGKHVGASALVVHGVKDPTTFEAIGYREAYD